MVYKCFDKKSFGEAVKSEIKNEEFAENYTNQLIENLKDKIQKTKNEILPICNN